MLPRGAGIVPSGRFPTAGTPKEGAYVPTLLYGCPRSAALYRYKVLTTMEMEDQDSNPCGCAPLWLTLHTIWLTLHYGRGHGAAQ